MLKVSNFVVETNLELPFNISFGKFLRAYGERARIVLKTIVTAVKRNVYKNIEK